MKKKQKGDEQQPDARPVFDRPDGHHDGHHSAALGKWTNGVIKTGPAVSLSPSRKEWAEKITYERRALTALISQHNDYMVKMMASLEEQELEWWRHVQADLCIPDGHPYFGRLQYRNGIVALASPGIPKKGKK